MVRRLEQVDGVLAEVVRGDDERDPALAEQALTKDPLQRRLEPIGPVLGPEQSTQPLAPAAPAKIASRSST